MNAPARFGQEMKRLFGKASKKAGMPPGTLVFVGERKSDESSIKVIDYDESELQEWKESTVEECLRLKETSTVSWINVDGLIDVEIIKRLGEGFGIHPLVMEDILNTSQRPKMEEYDDHMYLIMRILSFDSEEARIESEQISIVLRSNCVITFQEREGDCFDNIRARIKESKGRIRKMGSDYLAYALMDSIIDNYFMVMEAIGDQIEDIDMKVSSGVMEDTPKVINSLKRQMLIMRRSLWPLRDVINNMSRNESGLIQEDTRLFIRDIYSHTIELIETLETFREVLSGLLDMHMSAMSNRMNEVMKTLTIIATIFIPLTFIVGIYGMNFANMPELSWKWGYYVTCVIMIAIALSLLVFFRRKKWL